MRARPRVAYTVPQAPQEVFDRFQSALDDPACPCAGHVGRQEVTLHIELGTRKPWSPYLLLAVDEEEGHTVVRGVMGPQPNLWTAFVFVYAAHLVVFVSGSVYGFVQLTLGDSPTGLTFAGLALLGLALSCGLDLTGRRLGRQQMGMIRGLVEKTLPGAEELAEGTTPDAPVSVTP